MNTKIKKILLVTSSAVLLALPFHFDGLSGLAYVAFLPYFFAVTGLSASSSFKYSYLFGFIFFLFVGYWLWLVNVLGYIILVAYLALYFGVFGVFSAAYLEIDENAYFRTLWLLWIPAIWVMLEWVRSWMIGGLPWALLGASQWTNIPAIQIADITGIYGVSFFILLINLALFSILREWLVKKEDKNPWPSIVAVVLSVILVFGYGFYRLSQWSKLTDISDNKRVIRISLLQGNIPQDQKWDKRIKNIVFEKYKRMTLMSGLEKADLIVWPETAFPGFLEDEPMMSSQLRAVVRQSKSEVLVGAPTIIEEEGQPIRLRNSAILYGVDGEEKMRYDKLHLVPFGEYIPMEAVFGVIRHFVHIGRFSPGKDVTVFKSKSTQYGLKMPVQFSALICYEDIFPEISRQFCRKGAELLINMTNDAWFGKTTAPYQHAQSSVFRAVENRVNVVRATNTGFSCFISPDGRILDSVEEKGEKIFVTGRRTFDLVVQESQTFYTRFGDVFVILCGALCVIAYRQKRKQNSGAWN